MVRSSSPLQSTQAVVPSHILRVCTGSYDSPITTVSNINTEQLMWAWVFCLDSVLEMQGSNGVYITATVHDKGVDMVS